MKNKNKMSAANFYSNGFGLLALWKFGFVFEMIWEIRKQSLI